MKIAIFTDSFYPEINGLVTSLLQSTKALAENGNTILIFAPQYSNNSKHLNNNDLNNHNLINNNHLGGNDLFIHKNAAIIRLSSIPFFSYKGVRVIIPCKKKICLQLDKFKPDIIHIHQISVITPAVLKYSKKHNIPVIGTFHSLYTEMIEYILPYRLLKLNHIYEKNNDLNNNNLTRYKLFKKILWNILNKYYSELDAVIVPTIAIKNLLVKQMKLKHIEVISNGIITAEFIKKSDYTLQNKLLHFGRISYERNVDIIIKAFDIYLKRTGNKDMQLHIIGDGPDFPKIKILVKKLYIEKNVIFHGFISREKLKKTLKDYDFVITASTMETQGMVVLESFAVGLPVIGVDKYALPDLILHKKNGFIAKAFDTFQIADYMEMLIKSQQLRERFGNNAKYEAKKHELINIIRKLQTLYNNLSAKNLNK